MTDWNAGEVPRPRPNRVSPFGVFEAAAYKGALLGNRGDLHAADGSLGRKRWLGKAWIACTTAERGTYRVKFDRKGTYFPLFFFDEAVAFAAGHRPCAQCRRDDYRRFQAAWSVTQRGSAKRPLATAIDAALHAARLDGRAQRTVAYPAGNLPDGAFIVDPGDSSQAARIEHGAARRWSHRGYAAAATLDPGTVVIALTPQPLLAVLKAGYVIAAPDA